MRQHHPPNQHSGERSIWIYSLPTQNVSHVLSCSSASESIWNLTMSMVEHGVQEAGTGNALFSPVSILTTLNMLLLGTQGDTRTELLTALGNTLH